MFEFIQLCIKLITLFTKIAISNAPRAERLAAYDDASDIFHKHVMVVLGNLSLMGSGKFRLFSYWQYTVELAKHQAFAALFYREGSTFAAEQVAQSSTHVNVWAAKLGYEVVGV